jgi:protein involved in polysaccharide export with SLBB domain
MRTLWLVLLVGMGLLFVSIQQRSSASAKAGNTNAPCIVVFGAVRYPARLESRRSLRLHEVLAHAGGITKRAGATVKLIHSGSRCFQGVPNRGVLEKSAKPAEVVVVNVTDIRLGKLNPNVADGDVVIMEGPDPIYITGSVVKSQAVYPNQGTTLLSALDLAGGVRDVTRTTVIYRLKPDGNWRVALIVDLREAMKYRAKDPLLQAYDIVDVGGGKPLSPPRLYQVEQWLIPLPRRVIY